jgi:uncharacterized membrane protein YoaK (UPF0700 family)
MTDLSIELARWYRWRRTGAPEDMPPSKRNAAQSAIDKTVLLVVILSTFIAGAMLGAVLTFRASRWAMLAPAAAIFLASAAAFRTSRKPV